MQAMVAAPFCPCAARSCHPGVSRVVRLTARKESRNNRRVGESRVFTKGYVLYVVVLIAIAIAGARWAAIRVRPPTLEDMARPDYVDSPDRVLRKVDHD